MSGSYVLDTSSPGQDKTILPQPGQLVSNSVEDGNGKGISVLPLETPFSFGDRIIPRRATGHQEKKKLSSFVSQQPFESNQPSDEGKQPNETKQEFHQFFAPVPEPQSSTESPVQQEPKKNKSRVKGWPDPQVDIVTGAEAVAGYQSGENSSGIIDISTGQEVIEESIQNEFFRSPPAPSAPPQLENIQDNNNYQPTDPYQSTIQSAIPGLSYSYVVLGSSSTPDQFTSKYPSVVEGTTPEIGSPADAFSSIGQTYDQNSPFPQSETPASLSSYNPTENSSPKDPFYSQDNSIPVIDTWIQSVTKSPPTFNPSPPVITVTNQESNFLAKYPEPPVRVLEPPAIVGGNPDLEAPLKFSVPAANNYAGFIPTNVKDTSDTFSAFPKPNFASFYPPKSTETIYFGGNPNEPPSYLKSNVISFIKAHNANALQPPNEPKFPTPETFKIQTLPPKATVFNDFPSYLNNQNRPKPVPPKINIQPVRPPTSILQVNSLSLTKPNNLSAPRPLAPKPSAPRPLAPKPSTSNPPALKPSAPQPYAPVPLTNVQNPPVIVNVTPPSPLLNIRPYWSVPVKNPSYPKPVLNSSPAAHYPPTPRPAIPSNYFNVPPPVAKPVNNASPVPFKGSTAPIRVPPPVIQQNDWIPQHGIGGQKPAATLIKPHPNVPIKVIPPVNVPAPISTQGFKPPKPVTPVYSKPLSGISINSIRPSFNKSPAPVPILVPQPIYLIPAAITMPKPASRGTSASYSLPLAQPFNYHALVSYG